MIEAHERVTIDLYMDDIRPVPPGWVLARTITAAKKLLQTGTVNQMSLDHDMGACAACQEAGMSIGDQTTPETTYALWCSHEEDGTALMRWIIETGHWSKQKPKVHSANPVGAARMRAMIDRYWGRRS